MFLILCLTSVLLVASTADKPNYDIEKAEELFEDFIKVHGKVYPHYGEKKRRFEIFKENLKAINQKNSIGGAVFGINIFSDLTEEEFKRNYLGFNSSIGADECDVQYDRDITTKKAPASFNWATEGAVTPVKNQQNCGSCWAFSTIGNIEGQYFIKTKQLKNFSEQELVDCSKRNNGCGDGQMATAMSDLKQLGGVELESSYPYVAIAQTCSFDSTKVAVKLAGCTKFRLQDEEKLMEVLVNIGPIAIALNGDDVKKYQGGILHGDHCQPDPINHAVLLVGYGTENGVDFWILKNSWGNDWGEEGYFRITRGENTCGLISGLIVSAVL